MGRYRRNRRALEEPIPTRLAKSGARMIHLAARNIVSGRRSPAKGLDEIMSAARFGALVRGERFNDPSVWPETNIWPIYRPFYDIALRWRQAHERGDTARDPRLRAAFEQEVITAARAITIDGADQDAN